MEENFARVETKYLLTLSQAARVEESLVREGFERLSFGSPTVQSLYYDTTDYALIRASLERPSYKEKLRLRAYGEAGHITNTFLEIKKKYRGVVYKRRTPFPLPDAVRALACRNFPESAGPVGREALWMAERYGLVPAAVIAYDRDAWFSGDSSVRITFDRNLSFRDWEPDLNVPAENLPLIQSDLRLMEIKTEGVYPLWLTRLLREAGAERVHFSKYGLAYRQFILPEKEGIEGSGSNCSIVSLSRGA
jgi:hypothetical protein